MKDPREELRRALNALNAGAELTFRVFDPTPNWPKWDPALRVREEKDGILSVLSVADGKKTPEWSRAHQLWEDLDEEQRQAAAIQDSRLREELWPLVSDEAPTGKKRPPSKVVKKKTAIVKKKKPRKNA